MSELDNKFVHIALLPDAWCHVEPDQSDEVLMEEIVQRRPDALTCLPPERMQLLLLTTWRAWASAKSPGI